MAALSKIGETAIMSLRRVRASAPRHTLVAILGLILLASSILSVYHLRLGGLLYKVSASDYAGTGAYIFQDDIWLSDYYVNSSTAGFLWYWEKEAPGIWGYWGDVRSHSNPSYNLKPERVGYSFVYWEYEDAIDDDRVGSNDVSPTQTIIRNASDFSLVKFHWVTSKMNHTLYYGFWSDKPYVWVYIERTMNQDMLAENSQTCNMLSGNFQKAWWTNYTGQIQNWNYTGTQYHYTQPLFSALDSGAMTSYPFMSLYNDPANVTVGFIYLDATPNIRKDTHLWGFEVYPDDGFTEVQIDWGGETDGGRRYWRQNTTMGLEYLVLIRPGVPSSSGNVIDYSRMLYNNMTNVTGDVDPGMWSAAHQGSRRSPASARFPVGLCGHTVYTASTIGQQPRTYYIPYMDQISLTQKDWLDEFYYNVPSYSKWYFRHAPTLAVELDDQTVDQSFNQTISTTDSATGVIGWDRGSLNAYSHVTAFNNSDKLLHYGNVTLDDTTQCLNSSFILYYNRVNDTVKISDTEYDIRFIDPLFGWSGLYLKVDNGIIQEYADRLEIILFNYSSPQSEPAGTTYSYNFTLWGHTGNRTSMTDFFTQQPLTYKRLFQNFALDDNTFGFEAMKEYLIINSTYVSNQLVVYAINLTNGQKTVEISVGTGTIPLNVSVNSVPITFTYNSTSKIVSFNVTFSGVESIKVDFNYTLHLNAGWNLVSFPVIPADPSFTSILGVSNPQVRTWNGGTYVTPTMAEAGWGYLIFMLSATTVNITGTPVESYERDLPMDWSLIGSIYNTTVDADTVLPDPHQLKWFNGFIYIDVTTIESGKGYWTWLMAPTHITVEE